MWFLLNPSVTRKQFVRFTNVIYQIKGFSMEIHVKMGHTPAVGRSLLVLIIMLVVQKVLCFKKFVLLCSVVLFIYTFLIYTLLTYLFLFKLTYYVLSICLLFSSILCQHISLCSLHMFSHSLLFTAFPLLLSWLFQLFFGGATAFMGVVVFFFFPHLMKEDCILL